MKLNRTELKKIIYDFNSIANRLMRVHFDEYKHVLAKFIEYIDSTEVIKEFVDDCGTPSFDIADECSQVSSSYGDAIFELGDTDQLEVANIYGILKYVLESDIHITSLGMSYASSNKYQDMVKEFNERVLMVLIRHIEGYLTKIGIDMGMDESIKYAITVNNGQVNLASDNAVINATQNNGFYSEDLIRLIQQLKNQGSALPDEDRIAIEESLEVIENESKSEKPKKSLIKTALTTIQAIKGTAEFGAAVLALVQFIQTLV
ncbi:MAG: hypothetical protein PHR18_05140 [Oscillospiraceae bacterium]|nr:hypothetical protein [Oscillospiraceae bacterium]